MKTKRLIPKGKQLPESPHQKFINRWSGLKAKVNAINEKIAALHKDYTYEYSELKVDQEIPLPEGVKEGYNKFKIEKINVELSPSANGQIAISFSYTGQYLSDTLEAVKGSFRFKNTEETNSNGKDEEAPAIQSSN